ncbi:hypothetical protein [Prosthecobacter sp.]|uniref:hypothetical protein n=1 Tax=Prosthecobacter sp. TaxID=1965333 RepID=UPI0037839FBB
MNPRQDFTWHEQQLGALILAGTTAFIVGYGVGIFGAEIGGARLEVGTVLMRGVYCAFFPVILAWFTRTVWFFMVPIYMLGFGMSFGTLRSFKLLPEIFMEALRVVCSRLEGRQMIPETPPSHPDLPWIFAIMLWLTGLAAVLSRRRRFGHLAMPQ